jgi:phenylacetate-CoA ligase
MRKRGGGTARDSGRDLLSRFDFRKEKNWIADFLRLDIAAFQGSLRNEDGHFWERLGAVRALELFHAAAVRVPAYRDFLKKRRIRHTSVRTLGDFQDLPLTDKKNYVQAYPLEARCWDGKLEQSSLVPCSSGTSGEPRFWPRGGYQEFEAAVIHELIYKSVFEVDRYKTLAVIGFPMGLYVSGIATLLPSWLISNKGYDLTVVPVGINKNEILRVVSSLQRDFEQVLLIGHPFFIKDVIETGKKTGLEWSKKRLRLMFCSEGFSEEWRRYVLEKAGIPLESDTIISTYGSSEMLLMGHETPLSILARNRFENDSVLRKEFFGTPIVPDLFQYNPFFRYIESVDARLVFTSASGIPLIRFNLHDAGRTIPFSKVEALLQKTDWAGIDPVWRLPFVALHGRSDQTVVFYAANIYPEHVKAGLDENRFYRKLTGKFTMRKAYTTGMDEYLEVHIELQRGIKAGEALTKEITDHLVSTLTKINLEYREASSKLGKDLTPRVVLWPYQHEKYFRPGVKPKYVFREMP